MSFAAGPLIQVLPIWLRKEMSSERLSLLSEIRLRSGQWVELISMRGSRWIERTVTEDDLRFTVNLSSKYSPWTTTSHYQGYITIEGGHRIGISGNWIVDESGRRCLQNVTSLCIRVSKDIRNVSRDLYKFNGSILIVGRPSSGKTTLLRDLIREISSRHFGSVCVIDERKELFPMRGGKMCYSPGPRTDVLSGCPKGKGVEMAIRCMAPKVVAVDEITASEDCSALLEAGWCGVDILATAHASGKEDLFKRPVYRPLLDNKLFQGLVVMDTDRNWHFERI